METFERAQHQAGLMVVVVLVGEPKVREAVEDGVQREILLEP